MHFLFFESHSLKNTLKFQTWKPQNLCTLKFVAWKASLVNYQSLVPICTLPLYLHFLLRTVCPRVLNWEAPLSKPESASKVFSYKPPQFWSKEPQFEIFFSVGNVKNDSPLQFYSSFMWQFLPKFQNFQYSFMKNVFKDFSWIFLPTSKNVWRHKEL